MRKGTRAVGTMVSKNTATNSATGEIEMLSVDGAIEGRIAGACAFCSTSSCTQQDESQVKSTQAKAGVMATISNTAIMRSTNFIITIMPFTQRADRRFDDR
jgi:hypothetical protein